MNSSFYFGMTLIGSAVVILVILSVVSMINKQLDEDIQAAKRWLEQSEKIRPELVEAHCRGGANG